ncbi:putative aminotransferase [Aspergillus saccharolyticus JOP 1030-1]|uniref:ACC synthase n=1 Tax=Aspergillus saccharolyticus JOP 1030-1 TaxID=1450539 RepID=A0A318ZHJ8_9EURO|nr:ACC synthase [Aspergillus saccharolyticus JOP 1030-1]PYH47051.1 ACC synthase [Aspergillus saccharolyticus JOP 1030-1]
MASTPPRPAKVSQRAQDVIRTAGNNLIWDVLKDPWGATTNPNGYVNVGVAENPLMHETLLEHLNRSVELPAKYLTYNDGGSGSVRLRRAMAGFLNRNFHPAVPVQDDQLIVTNGVSPAIEHISWTFTDPGEGILLGRPFYGTFVPDLSLRFGACVVQVAFDDCDPFSLGAVDKYEQALLQFQRETGRKVKALMLCHPHNPLGRCYPRPVLVALMKLCQKYGVHFVSDEIYALSVWENTVDELPAPVAFESALSIDLAGIIDPTLVHVLWGLSKDFGANGLRMGVIISQCNRDVHTALGAISLYSYTSGTADHLAARLLEDVEFTDKYIVANQAKLAQMYAYAARRLQDLGIEYAPGCNAAFFLWVNLGKRFVELHPEEAGGAVGDRVMQRLVQAKVFLASGALFGSERDGWFRIVFTHPIEYLELAFKRIDAALKKRDGTITC